MKESFEQSFPKKESLEDYQNIKESLDKLQDLRGILSLEQYIDSLEELREKQAENEEIRKEARNLKTEVFDRLSNILQQEKEIPSDIQSRINELFLEPEKHIIEFNKKASWYDSLYDDSEKKEMDERIQRIDSAMQGDRKSLKEEIIALSQEESEESKES